MNSKLKQIIREEVQNHLLVEAGKTSKAFYAVIKILEQELDVLQPKEQKIVATHLTRFLKDYLK